MHLPLWVALVVWLSALPSGAAADDLERWRTDLAHGTVAEKVAAIEALALANDAGARSMLEGLAAGTLTGPAGEEIVLNNRARQVLQAAVAMARLAAPDLPSAVRREAARQLAQTSPPRRLLPLLASLHERESDPEVSEPLTLALAKARLASPERNERLAAIAILADHPSPTVRALLASLSREENESDPEVRQAASAAFAAVDRALALGYTLGTVAAGVSLGSILLLVALGLAITYGVMGVINMAHGEFLMIGAYSAFIAQTLMRLYAPGWFDLYPVLALPIAFFAAGMVGWVIERGVIRWLYGRPLETLLATWGVSLILIQSVRLLFGPQNVEIANPSWLTGSWQPLPGWTLPVNRVAVFVFSLAVLAVVVWWLRATRFGLWVRAVTQNRPMASALGVPTPRVDAGAFAVGAGVAGLGGVALSQIANVGPDMGQGYIVDAFMVVVIGGVGQLAGAIWAAFGLGIVNKLLEGWIGAVLAKIAVLVLIILFIQKRPQGLFALKGRMAE